MFRASFCTCSRHGSYGRDIPSSLFEKETSTMNVTEFSWKVRSFLCPDFDIYDVQCFTEGEMGNIALLNLHGHNASTRTIEWNVYTKVNRFSLWMTATVDYDKFCTGKMHYISQYIKLCATGNTYVWWHCICTITAYNNIHRLYNNTGRNIFSDI